MPLFQMEEGQTGKPIIRLHLGVGSSQHANYDANQGKVSPADQSLNQDEFAIKSPYSHSTKSSNTRISINSCNLDNLLSFVKNAFAP